MLPVCLNRALNALDTRMQGQLSTVLFAVHYISMSMLSRTSEFAGANVVTPGQNTRAAIHRTYLYILLIELRCRLSQQISINQAFITYF